MAVDKRGRKLPKGVRQKGSRFEGRVTYQEKTYSVYGDTVKETQTKMTELKYKLEHGVFVEKSKLTLDQWFDTWIEEYKKNQVKIGTYTNYKNYYRCMLKERLGSRYIADIRGEHIQKLYNDYVKEDYSLTAIKSTAIILNGCFKQAVKNGLIEKNPVLNTELPRRKEKKVKEAMTKEQQTLFMEYAKDSYLYNLFAIMLRTGMRIGELQALKYSDINRKNNVIEVRRTLKYIVGIGYLEDTPKTRTSKRDIPLTTATLQLFENQKKQWSRKIGNINGYIFTNEKGEPLSRDKVQGEIDRIVKRIRKDGYEFNHISPHIFRHTFATRAIEAGMQPQVLKTIMGHSSLAMTMDLYSHVMEDVKVNEMEKIDIAF
ncbi:MAG: site-specific integrase [Firmicutes bacterium]|nr:site-specific integrase [Bacillota bacterium]